VDFSCLAMTQDQDRVGRILTHNVQPAHLGIGLLDNLAHRDIQPRETPPLTGPRQEEVVGQVLQTQDMVHLLDAVDLDALVVVDVGPLLLGHREEVLGVEPGDGVHGLQRVDLAHQSLGVPVEGGQVAAAAAQQQVAAISEILLS
jgi:hypothetical protein